MWIITSPETPNYNCIAWAAGDTHRWWWPDPDGVAYWPPGVTREVSVQAFIEAFGTLGFQELTDDDELDEQSEVVAIYADPQGTPTHAARMLPGGVWSSKCGQWHDIMHDSHSAYPDGIEYGSVVVILTRRRSSPA